MREVLGNIHTSEEGHVYTLPGIALSAAGVIGLAIGAASDTDWLTIAGGIVAAFGALAYDVLRHTKLDYGVYDRLNELEKKR